MKRHTTAMANRHNHYEAAFEAYLRAERVAYVAVNEQRRTLAGDASIKSVDYIVSPGGRGGSWLVDVKGRRFPSGRRQRQYWKNWATQDDLDSLVDWRARFGDGFDAALVFAYHLTDQLTPVPAEQVFYFRGRAYAFVAITLSDYLAYARPLSQRWGTLAAPVADFRRTARGLVDLLDDAAAEAAWPEPWEGVVQGA